MVKKRLSMQRRDQIDKIDHTHANSEKRILTVDVTDEDIKNSVPGRPTQCAISTALRRVLGEARFACTRHNRMSLTVDGRYLHFEINDKASDFIRRYDLGEPVEPTTLTFRLGTVGKVTQISEERKQQINAARNRRREEGRPDKAYDKDPKQPMRLRMALDAKAKARDELRDAIDKANRDAEVAHE